MKIINFVPQQKTETSPLIKMNCIFLKNSNKNCLTVHNEKEKGNEKLEENKTNQVNSKDNQVKFETN